VAVCSPTLSANQKISHKATFQRSSGALPPGSIGGHQLSLPWANSYIFYNHQTKRSDTRSGFVGIGVALFYKKDRHKYSLNIGFTGDLPMPFGPVTFDPHSTRYHTGTLFAETLYHYNMHPKWRIDGGVNRVT
jgi:hypothetical protein